MNPPTSRSMLFTIYFVVFKLQVWNSNYPCTEKYSQNMKQFSWKYTQYSQFNQSDTLLLVSGVHFGSPQTTSGEIAVFTVDSEYFVNFVFDINIFEHFFVKTKFSYFLLNFNCFKNIVFEKFN